MGSLPTELTDIVIDFLHSDTRALKVCSLVCRNWLPASRFHLFGAVHIEPFGVLDFAELLDSPVSSIAGHVHTLHIHLQDIHKYDIRIPVFDIIALYLKEFVAVRSISLKGWRWVSVSDEERFGEFGAIGNMELTRIFCNFSTRWFTLDFTINNDHDPSSFSSSLSTLRSVISGSQQPTLWLPVAAQFPVVGEIELSRIQESHLPTVQTVLISGGTSIHSIRLAFRFGQSVVESISEHVNLTHNTNLRSLSIQNLNLQNSRLVAGHGSFYKIIERISSLCITHVHIGVLVCDYTDLAWLDCRKVADVLNHSRFSGLEEVHINIEAFSGEQEELEAWVRREMSSLVNVNLTVAFTAFQRLA